ncbi:MAG TPA: lipid-A-disaccharide synthase [Thermosynechococcaceae cyanobacterium]
MEAVDILILSNGPGELATWVKPVVRELRDRLGEPSQVRISVVLSPCSNANGQEAAVARRYPEVDRVQAAEHFFPFLLWGKTEENWDWHDRGVVLFLGGDQFFPVVIGKRLGYRTVVYAEWEARWHRWIDRFGVMQPGIIDRAPAAYTHKLTVVGDLIAEVGKHSVQAQPQSNTLIGLLPGSKPSKLNLGLPLMLAIAEHLQAARPDLHFALPVAPALELTELARFADRQQNSTIQQLGWGEAELAPDRSHLKTPSGLSVELHTEFPAYDLLSQCRLCLTIVGANTAELGSLAVPMLVLLPTQQLDAMRSWDGLPGLLANLPGVGSGVATLINWFALRRLGLLAWPNIWAGREIVPELVGRLQPQQVADRVLDFLSHPEKLQQMQADLRSVRGEPGAAAKLVQLVCEELLYEKLGSEPRRSPGNK